MQQRRDKYEFEGEVVDHERMTEGGSIHSSYESDRHAYISMKDGQGKEREWHIKAIQSESVVRGVPLLTVVQGCRELRWCVGRTEVDWRFRTLWFARGDAEGMVIMRACVRGRGMQK